MKQKDAYERLIREYLMKVKQCDECVASLYCTLNLLRKSREPQNCCMENCIENIKNYFKELGETY